MFEKGRDEVKIDAMKRLLIIMVNGNPMPELLMHIIRFVMPSKNKELKKLLHFYWEICPKLQPNGTLKQEMILVCNAIRNDLQHPNEYIRGATLRFLCKLREADLLDPLIPSILACLEHRHAYVRKNAVFAVYSIASYASHHIPDAAELINTFLETETDATCIRNAFVALSNMDRDRAFAFLQQKYQSIATQDELLQLAFIEFIRKDAVENPELKKSYLSIVFDILESSSNTAIYEAATALTKLSSDPNAIKAAASKLVELAVKEADNNVKLIVFDRVEQLHLQNPNMLNDLTMDILAALSSPDLDVRKKVLKIALGMVSSRNVDDVVKYLKKELTKTVHHNYEKNSEYRQLLIQAIHTCAIRFAEVAASVVDLLLDFIGDSSSTAAVDVISFVKEVVEIFPKLRASIVSRLLQTIETVRGSSVYRGALWIIGEYSLEEQDIQEAWVHIRKSLGEIPILASERRHLSAGDEEETEASAKPAEHHKPKVLADGTYATETAFTTEAHEEHKANRPPLRSLILNGNYFVAAVLASTLTKLVLRYQKISKNEARKNALRAEALLIMTSILRVSESEIVSQKMDEDTSERIFSCIKVLAEGYQEQPLEEAFLEDSKAAFKSIVQVQEKQRAETNALEKKKNAIQVDESLMFRQFAQTTVAGNTSDDLDQDIARASGTSQVTADKPVSKLSRVVQLTGYSDSVYVEAFVNVHQFDIVLDVLIFNQTFDTLQNLYVEFATLGDLKVFSQPIPHNVGPQSFHSIQATIKVSSADAGVIFGNVIYEGSSGSDGNIVILNDVHVDIMDYIKPGHYSETEFRTMWSEFEWENKVNISVQWKSLRGFLAYLMKNTNMNCLTTSALGEGEDDEDECQFLSANLHARSTFGEDALANLSIEKDASGKITGHVRIRSKGQGLALSLGDRVAELQRQHVSATASEKALSK